MARSKSTAGFREVGADANAAHEVATRVGTLPDEPREGLPDCARDSSPEPMPATVSEPTHESPIFESPSRSVSDATAPLCRRARLLHAPRYRGHSYGDNHPLGIPRVSLTIDLIQAFDAVTPDELLETRAAFPAELEWFHTRAYVNAMQAAERAGKVFQLWRDRHNIGNFENPFLPDMYQTPATATFASIHAAECALGGVMAFNPAGGMHHARADAARGFCYFNDPALAILRLRQAGQRVLYLDIDAHHGDGVEAAFADDADALTVSLHMDTVDAFPFEGGGIDDIGPLGNAINLPLPRGSGDGAWGDAFDALWPASLERFQPDFVVVQAGTDAIFADPLGKFGVTTQLFLSAMERIVQFSPRHANGVPKLVVLGGGGYHPVVLARAWTGVWAALSGRVLPETIPERGQRLLRAIDWDHDEDEDWFERLFVSRLDAPRPPEPRELRREVAERIERLLSGHPRLR